MESFGLGGGLVSRKLLRWDLGTPVAREADDSGRRRPGRGDQRAELNPSLAGSGQDGTAWPKNLLKKDRYVFPLPYLGETDPLKAAGLPVGATDSLLSSPEKARAFLPPTSAPYSLLDPSQFSSSAIQKMTEVPHTLATSTLPYASTLGYQNGAFGSLSCPSQHTHTHPSPTNPGYVVPCNCTAWSASSLQPPVAYILFPGMTKTGIDPYSSAHATAM
ncbi:PREDICTED: transcription factor SOX-14 [Corvus brachyrhynchos]|uniref:transcription factor SOX-14 n=1 Tax=Corvus brachyrhynchos TaxID=85066 RepID=UPI0008167701|nr:PREDICTED: transcription factor SOX-14 [Corvus brachyrhynchos]